MHAFVLDTSFLSALLVERDVHHKKAHKISEKLPEESYFFIPFVVASELLILGDSRKILTEIKKISKSFIRNTESDLDYISSIPNNIRKQLKANDCLIMSIVNKKNASLITFDKKLRKNAKLMKLKVVEG
ncbi:MAG TPA: type II toxin-antitoxin system VapC family toxin [Candidatus Dojkabacteria bacterium]|jgi:predicted nucleic acid-binding protein